ncbi:MAG: DUF2924 domain-containing protein [Bacteroidales bacterium]|nr:DUF2924 domain-containing protein [Bacteroidales bacterium]
MSFDVDKELAKLEEATTGQLIERFAELFGTQTHSRHRTYLIRKILWKLQTNEAGDLSERAKKRAKELSKESELRVMPPTTLDKKPVAAMTIDLKVKRDPRLPLPGAALLREYKGKRYEVIVHATDFEFEGERYRSLSAIAHKITGCHVNGFRFFNLVEGGK